MDLRQLQSFLTISELLSFTKAAEQLGYAQSSVTAQIQQLENELGIRLFERIGKSIFLTDAGTRLIQYAAEILSLAKTMKSVGADVGDPAGTLTIGTSESLSISRLPPVLREFRRLYPGVELSLKLLSCGDFLPNLSRGAIDVAFAIGTTLETDRTTIIMEMPEPILVLAHPGHPLTLKPAVTAQDFQDEALLLTGPGCAYGGAFRARLDQQRIITKTVLETESVQVIKQAAVSGLGLCVLPAVAVAEDIAAGTLVPLDYDTEDFNIVSQLLVHKDKWRSPALRAFQELAVQLLSQ